MTKLREGLDIRTSSPVSAITLAADGVTVVADGQALEGSHAIVTVPLGVLQADAITFDPPLPAAKQAAIQRLEMGNLEKVVFVFDQLPTLPFAGDAMGYAAGVGAERAWSAFYDFSKETGVPTVACLYDGGFARKVQSERTDEQIAAGALAALKEVVPEVGSPTATKVTRWHTDPYARGSYSFMPVGSSPDDMDALAEPVGGRLLFAGEATYKTAYQTVHGALLSGLREAARVKAGAEIEA